MRSCHGVVLLRCTCVCFVCVLCLLIAWCAWACARVRMDGGGEGLLARGRHHAEGIQVGAGRRAVRGGGQAGMERSGHRNCVQACYGRSRIGSRDGIGACTIERVISNLRGRLRPQGNWTLGARGDGKHGNRGGGEMASVFHRPRQSEKTGVVSCNLFQHGRPRSQPSTGFGELT